MTLPNPMSSRATPTQPRRARRASRCRRPPAAHPRSAAVRLVRAARAAELRPVSGGGRRRRGLLDAARRALRRPRRQSRPPRRQMGLPHRRGPRLPAPPRAAGNPQPEPRRARDARRSSPTTSPRPAPRSKRSAASRPARAPSTLLMEAGWVRMRGRRRTPGRPVTYGTTEAFLDHFGLESPRRSAGPRRAQGGRAPLRPPAALDADPAALRRPAARGRGSAR